MFLYLLATYNAGQYGGEGKFQELADDLVNEFFA
jgi:hypothetical protein